MSIVEIVAKYLGYDIATIRTLSNNASTTYKKYNIPKRSGGTRIIYQPSKQTKSLQYALMNTVLNRLNVHESAAAYKRGNQSPVLKNAQIHSNYAFSIRVDLKEFFPSIKPVDLLPLLKNHFSISKDDEEFLSDVLFIKQKDGIARLAIGAPSSPLISNAVMYEIDKFLIGFANSKFGVYTRYADDLVFSTNTKDVCKDFHAIVEDLLLTTSSPKLQINSSKTKYSSRGTRRIITGLIITPQGNVSIGRHNKRYIRKLLWDFKNNSIGTKELAYLQGYLAFILDTEPDLYNRLALKYGGSIVVKALQS